MANENRYFQHEVPTCGHVMIPKFLRSINKLRNNQECIETTMCYRVECKKCGKYGWGGCGEHVKLVYGGIEKGKHCMCRSWPGVVIASSETASASTTTTTTATTATSTAGDVD